MTQYENLNGCDIIKNGDSVINTVCKYIIQPNDYWQFYNSKFDMYEGEALHYYD